MVDATATIVAVATSTLKPPRSTSGNDPTSVPGFTYIELTPERVQVRTRGVRGALGVMRHGV